MKRYEIIIRKNDSKITSFLKTPVNKIINRGFYCTRSGNRTHTILLSLDFESSASTNSAIRASKQGGKYTYLFFSYQNYLLNFILLYIRINFKDENYNY